MERFRAHRFSCMSKRHMRRVISNEISKEKLRIYKKSGSNIIESGSMEESGCSASNHFQNVPVINTLCSQTKSSPTNNITIPANCDIPGLQKLNYNLVNVCENNTNTSTNAPSLSMTNTTNVFCATNNKTKFESSIKQWVLKFRSLLSQQAINELLRICREEGGNDFPKDSRTFIETPKKCENIEKIPGGCYAHIGIESGLKNVLKLVKINSNEVVNVTVNVDGLPLTKSSNSQIWPILISVDSEDIMVNKPFIAGIFHGSNKPENVNIFFRNFVEEFKSLQTKGLILNNGVTVFLNISKIVCDAPAKSFVLAVKGHNGYSGCTKCTEEGTFINGRMTYPHLNSPLRTDKQFLLKSDEEYHKGKSPFEDLNVGLVSQVPLDYMHLVCLGVMKRILTHWVKGKRDVRILDTDLSKASDNLLQIKKYLPVEFARLPRNLNEVDRFKATEFRQLLLYTGPVIFKNILSRDQYKHFMSLHCAIRILCSPKFYLVHNDYANDLLKYFIKNYGTLYGHEHISHNVHNLIHLPSDCKMHGPLDNFSSFKFESFLYQIKKTVKFSRNPLPQIICRLKEKEHLEAEHCNNTYPYLKNEKENTVQINEHITCYKTLVCKDFEIIINSKDDCVILNDNSVLLVQDIFQMVVSKNIFIVGRKFLNVKPFFLEPCDSGILGINIVDSISANCITVPLDDIQLKCFKCPYKENSYVIIPLLHNENM